MSRTADPQRRQQLAGRDPGEFFVLMRWLENKKE
jgi:hypothetical protein